MISNGVFWESCLMHIFHFVFKILIFKLFLIYFFIVSPFKFNKNVSSNRLFARHAYQISCQFRFADIIYSSKSTSVVTIHTWKHSRSEFSLIPHALPPFFSYSTAFIWSDKFYMLTKHFFTKYFHSCTQHLACTHRQLPEYHFL